MLDTPSTDSLTLPAWAFLAVTPSLQGLQDLSAKVRGGRASNPRSQREVRAWKQKHQSSALI